MHMTMMRTAAVRRIGINARVLNSVIMSGCVIGDGCHVAGCILASDVVVARGAQLKDCQVGPGRTVPENADHRDEQLV